MASVIERLSGELYSQYHNYLEDKLKLFEGGIRRKGAVFIKEQHPHPNNVLLDEVYLLDDIPIVRGRVIFRNNHYEIEIRNCADFTRDFYLVN